MNEKEFITLSNNKDLSFLATGKKDLTSRLGGVKNIKSIYTVAISGFTKVYSFAINLVAGLQIDFLNFRAIKKIILIHNILEGDIILTPKQTKKFSYSLGIDLDVLIPIYKQVKIDLAILEEIFVSAEVKSISRSAIDILPDLEVSVETDSLLRGSFVILIENDLLFANFSEVKKFAIENNINEDLLFSTIASLKTNLNLLEEVDFNENSILKELKKAMISQTNEISISIVYELAAYLKLQDYYPDTLASMYSVTMGQLTRSVI